MIGTHERTLPSVRGAAVKRTWELLRTRKVGLSAGRRGLATDVRHYARQLGGSQQRRRCEPRRHRVTPATASAYPEPRLCQPGLASVSVSSRHGRGRGVNRFVRWQLSLLKAL